MLNGRVIKQQRVLKQIFWAVIVVWVVATGIVVNAQWPAAAATSWNFAQGQAKNSWAALEAVAKRRFIP